MDRPLLRGVRGVRAQLDRPLLRGGEGWGGGWVGWGDW